MNTSYLRAKHKQESIVRVAEETLRRLTPTNPQRCVTVVLRRILLNTSEPYYWNGVPYQLRKKSLGAGVYEIRLEEYKS